MPKQQNRGSRWIFAIMVLAVLALVSLLMAACLSAFVVPQDKASSGNVARIRLEGEISSSLSGSLFSQNTASAEEIVGLLDEANKNPEIKAILLEINSPGGAAVASEDIVRELKTINKTKVALIKDEGTSGAYWVASATDEIVASPISITGSIGVLSSYLEFSGLMQKYGVDYVRLVGGEYKDIGAPFRNLTPEERDLFQQRVDIVHQYFIDDVARNRNMDPSKVKELATGIFYLGSQAKENGLIDTLGGEKEAEAAIKQKAGLTEIAIVDYEKKRSFLDVFTQVLSRQSFNLGEGLGQSIINSQSSGQQLSLKN